MANKFLDYDGLEEVVEQIDAKYAKIALTLPSTTKYGASLDLSINSTTYVVTAQLKDQDGNNLGTAQTIDLPLESVVVSGSYDAQTKEVVLTLQNGSTIKFSVADLVSGLQSEITSTNKLSADLVDDTNTTNKFVTASDKTNWNGKQDALTAGDNIAILNNVISAKSGVKEITEPTNMWELDDGVYFAPKNYLYYKNNTPIGSSTDKSFVIITTQTTVSPAIKSYLAISLSSFYYGGASYVGGTLHIKAIIEMLTINDVVNNLTSTSTTAPLSANMGKTLKDEIDTLPDTAITIAEIDALFS